MDGYSKLDIVSTLCTTGTSSNQFREVFIYSVLHNIMLIFSLQFLLKSDAPSAPGKPEVTDYNTTKITITWTPPESDGGSPITGYFVERKEKTSSRWVRVTKETITETTFTATGLTEGTEYQFRVYAENLAGPGPASEPSDLQKAKLPFGKGDFRMQYC